MSFLRLVSRIVPEAQRAEWLREWEAEWRWYGRYRPSGWRGRRRLLGALSHALWLRRKEWSFHMWSHDLRYAVRVLIRQPTVSLAAVLTLALGIGAGTAIFSVVDGVLLQPLPYRAPDRLAAVQYRYTDTGNRNDYISIPDFFDWRRARTFSGLAAVDWPLARTLTGHGAPEKLTAAVATPDFFRVLGVDPAIGRFFRDDEATPGQDAVVVLSHGLWQRRFGGEAGVIGRTVLLDGQPHDVIGVMPAGLELPTPADVWRPLAGAPGAARRRVNLLMVFGRLAPGVSFDTAQAEMTTIARQLEAAHPDTNANHGIAVVPLREAWLGEQQRPMLLLLGAVGLLLVLATANVSNLLLVRIITRQGELALRVVLGASRLRVLRQTVVEALVLAGCGGLIGVLLAQMSLGILSGLLPADLPRMSQVGVDLRALTVALVTVAGVCVTLSVLFAGRAAQLDLGERGGDGRDPGRRSRPSWLGGSLVGAQVAVTTVLLFAAVLLGRSLLELNGVDPGFRTSGLMSFRVSLPDDAYPAASDAIGFFDRLVPSLRGLPAVEAVQLTSAVPLGGSQRTTAVHAQTGEREEVRAGFHAVTGGYFELLGIPLRAGRLFVETDGPGAPEVAVVDETLAARLWPGESPIGRLMSRSGPDGPWIEVVGVVGAVRHRDLRRPASPTYYSSYRQRGWDTMNVVLSTSASPAAVVDLVRSRVAAIDPDQPVEAVTTLDDLLFASTASTRLQAVLLGVFGVVALAVASLGIYAVVAHRVERRVPEIGIRIALGATRAAILRLVLRQGWAPVAVGIATGLGGALAAQGVLASLLFGVVPGDPVSLALVVGLLLVVALLATYVPARRAARLDPARALLAG